MSKNLYFGGSFDPVHLGHLICARTAAEIIGCDRIVLVPTAISPLKQRQDGVASATDRVKMLQLACDELLEASGTAANCPAADDVQFAVDDLEIGRPGPSYTIDTVRQLAKRGEKRPRWLIGADGIATLPKWHEAEKLMAEAEFFVMARAGWTFDFATLPAAFAPLEQRIVRGPQIEISSTDIRERVRGGKSIDLLCPPSVSRYIRERGLYR